MTNSSSRKLSFDDYMAIIAKYPLFCLLKQEDIQELAQLVKERHVSVGEEITNEGDLVDAVYLIVSGSAEVFRTVNRVGDTQTIRVAVLGEGDAIGLGETGFFSTSGLRTAVVTAITPMFLLQIDIKDFQNFLQKPSVTYPALKSISEKILFMYFLKNSELLGQLSSEQIHFVANKADKILVKSGTMLFNQGELADKFYYLISGKMAIIADEGSEKRLIKILEPPNIFGEAAFLAQGKRNASVRAETDCELFVLSNEQIGFLLDKKVREDVNQSLENIRIQQLRPVKRPGLVIIKESPTDEQNRAVLENTVDKSKLTLTAKEFFIWQSLDDNLSLGSLLQSKLREMPVNELYDFLFKLKEAGFVELSMDETDSNRKTSSFISRWFKKLKRRKSR